MTNSTGCDVSVDSDNPRASIYYVVVAYPVVSETFVYREIRLLQQRGFKVYLAALRHRPLSPELDVTGLPRSLGLYEKGVVLDVLLGLLKLAFKRPRGLLKGGGWLLSDLRKVGGVKSRSKLLAQMVASIRLAADVVDNGVERIHAHFIHTPCQVAMYAAAVAGVPYTVTAHANDIFASGSLLLEKATRAKKVVTISEFNKRYFETIGVDAGSVDVVRCILDFPFSSGSSSVLSKPIVIGSLGRLMPKKGFATLIKAFARLRQANPELEVSLEIAGGGPQEQELKALVERLGVSSHVRFLGVLHPQKVFDWMRGLSCFVLACEEDTNGAIDGIPVVLMEAMSCSLPVISTRLSGIPELVIDGQTGILVEPGDAAALCVALDKLLADEALANKLVDAAREHLFKEFSKEVNLQRLVSSLAS